MTNSQLQTTFSSNGLAQPGMPGSQPEQGISVAEILRRLSAHRWFIMACGLLCLLLSGAYLKLKPPVYEASALLRIEPGRAGDMGLSDLQGSNPNEPTAALRTELVVLKSDAVAIRTLNALPDEAFQQFAGQHRTQLLPEDVEKLTPEQQSLVNKLQDHITVKEVEGTQLVTVSVRDRNARLAALLDNDLLKAYSVQSFSNRDRSVAQLRGWLSAQMGELQNQVSSAQTKLADFERENHVVEGIGTGNSIGDRLHVLNDRLAAAQSDRIEKEAQMHAAQGAGPAELATAFPNPEVTTLQSTRGTLYAQFAQLSTKFGPQYPPLVEISNQIQKIDNEIGRKVQASRNRLRQDYEASRQAEKMLQAEYDQQSQLAYGLTRNQAEYAVLQSDVTSSRELYDTLRRKLQQAAVDTEVGGLNTTLVQIARVPVRSSGPSKPLILAGGLILGLVAGVFSALLFEATSDRIHGSTELEAQIGLPVLATVPALPASPQLASRSHSTAGELIARLPTLLREPDSPYAEAIYALRNSTLLAQNARVVLIASACRDQGAGEIAANLAVALAQVGMRVLVVDTDLANPSAHLELGVTNDKGLGDFLEHPMLKPKPIQPIRTLPNFSALPAGNTTQVVSASLASAHFQAQMQDWRQSYDHVVLACSPLRKGSTSIVLANRVDTTIVVACYGSSRLSELKRVRNRLQRSAVHVEGLVLSNYPQKQAKRSLLGLSEAQHA